MIARPHVFSLQQYDLLCFIAVVARGLMFVPFLGGSMVERQGPWRRFPDQKSQARCCCPCKKLLFDLSLPIIDAIHNKEHQQENVPRIFDEKERRGTNQSSFFFPARGFIPIAVAAS
jgi:hypothetical protein